VAPRRALVSEPGSLSLEFTRLSQLTGNPKYYDAVQRISDEFEKSQNSTRYPGMWPVGIDIQQLRFDEDTMFTMGGMSDSAYEYLPKQYMILGGALEQSQKMYGNFITVAKEKMFFSFLNPKNLKLKVSGDIRVRGKPEDKRAELIPRGQHLTCFTGGMVGIASRIFNRPDEMQLAEELTNGCIWAYDSSVNGVAPEIFTVVPCPDADCTWSKQKWHDALYAAYPHGPQISAEETTKSIETIAHDRRLPPGFATIDDRRYILRPEAIESVFILYRITGDRKYADAAWRMFQAVEGISRTNVAAAAVMDVTLPKEKLQQLDSMESFWLAETLKYFYLCFEEWETVSLDDWVLNTEAHPLRRPGR
jgi:mannosyl-oligosaccharide alpha-1,2-mannosidase